MKSTTSGTPKILLLLGFLFLIAGCGSKKKSEEIKNYEYKAENTVMNPQMQAKLGSWLEEGTVCYGLVVRVDKEGGMIDGLPVKAKVTTITSDSIKMKALETVSLADVKGCTKMGLTKGQSWWETDGELFQTRDEAADWLKARGLLRTEGQETIKID